MGLLLTGFLAVLLWNGTYLVADAEAIYLPGDCIRLTLCDYWVGTYGSLLYFEGTSSFFWPERTMMSAIASVASSSATNLARSCLLWNDLLLSTEDKE